ncbi:MAG: DUF4838 domain-containing protein [Thermoguttaceae bacterium]|nr:DUF4838 domain-containing protein [Thermoguttaceae bacterium]
MKKFPAARAVFFALFVLITLPPLAAEEILRLADNGASDYTVVLPDHPSAVQKTAAEELASFLGQVTGAEFPILSQEQAKDKQKLLVIGPGELSKQMLASAGAEPEETIAQDGIIVQTVGGSIVFSGHRDRGPLYAVYTFLEDIVGCRWWTGTESTIPSRPTLDIEAVHLRYAPKVISREAYYRDPLDGREGGIFSARMKMNGHFNPVPAEYGGHMPILFWAHSFEQVLPPEKYFEEHPDWYSLVDGQRRGEGQYQLCLTNPEMKAEFIRNTLTALRSNPDTRSVSVSQNDRDGWCQCPECQKLAEDNLSQSGPLITFVNEVAEAIEQEFPNVLVETLAYNQSRPAPAKVRPRDNVLIRLCTGGNSLVIPLEEGGPNQSLAAVIESWSAISKQLYIWDYVTNFHNYLLPHPNLRVLAPNIRFFVKNHAIGIFEQGDAGCSAGDFVRMRHWVLSKLLWNPSLDQTALEDQFLNGYYSPRIAALFRQYLDVLQRGALQSEIPPSGSPQSTQEWLSTETLVEATKLMDQAIAAAREDEENDPIRFAGLTRKVTRESIPIRSVWIDQWRARDAEMAVAGIPSPIACPMIDYLHEFVSLLRENHVEWVREEWQGKEELDRRLAVLEQLFGAPAAEPPAQVEGLPADSWFDVQEPYFRLSGLGYWVFLEEDPNASNKLAARMPTDHTQWAAAWNSDRAEALVSPAGTEPDSDGRLSARVLLVARCDALPRGEDRGAMAVGIYDETAKEGLFTRVLTSGELAGSDYKLFDLGTFPLGKGILIWTSPFDRTVPNVYIDRIVVIRQ